MSRSKIAVLVAAVLAVAALIAVIGLAAMRDTRGSEPAVERVRIEIRSNPAAAILMNGKNIGTTPLSIRVASSTQPVVLDALMEQTLYTLRGEGTRNERKMTRTIVPDHDQLVDFVLPVKLREREPK